VNKATTKETIYDGAGINKLEESSCKDIIDKIYTKSNNIKAKLKFKYLIYKLERNFRQKKFYRFMEL
jgi:hypothetical protein